MAIANLIGAAVGVFLLLLVAYLLIGATLITAETVMAAQRDMTEVHSGVRGTSIAIIDHAINEDNDRLYINITNDGTTVIENPRQIDIFIATENGNQVRADWNRNVIEITPDLINPGFLDPGEYLNMSVDINPETPLVWVKVATPTGATASRYLTGGSS